MIDTDTFNQYITELDEKLSNLYVQVQQREERD